MSEGKNAKHAELIAESRAWVRRLGAADIETNSEVMLWRIASALEAADARNAAEYQRGHDRAERRYKSAIGNYKLVAETFEAERDTALAVITAARAKAKSHSAYPHDSWRGRAFAEGSEFAAEEILDVLATAPADALAELKRVIAEKAWDAGFEECDSRARGEWPPKENPYRANHELKEGE